MTTEAIEGVVESSGDTKPKEWWAVFPLKGRDVHFLPPSPEQLMVLRRLARQLNVDGQPAGRVMTTMAKILDAVSACMSSDEERDYADQLVLDREIDMDTLAQMIKAALGGPNRQPEKKAPAKRVRRR